MAKNRAVYLLLTYLLINVHLGGECSAQRIQSLNNKFYEWTQSNLGVRETHGNNRSPIIDEWNRAANAPLGANWCGSYVHAGQQYMGWTSPSAPSWSPAWARKAERTTKIDTGYKFTIFYPSLKRVGHVGFVIASNGSQVFTNEGNTNVAGSRTGIGVFNRRRNIATLEGVYRWR